MNADTCNRARLLLQDALEDPVMLALAMRNTAGGVLSDEHESPEAMFARWDYESIKWLRGLSREWALQGA